MCPKEQVVMCFGCMGKHYLMQCKDFACWGCGKTGHMSKDCSFHHGKKCFRCNKYGHKFDSCRIFMPEIYKRNYQDRFAIEQNKEKTAR